MKFERQILLERDKEEYRWKENVLRSGVEPPSVKRRQSWVGNGDKETLVVVVVVIVMWRE